MNENERDDLFNQNINNDNEVLEDMITVKEVSDEELRAEFEKENEAHEEERIREWIGQEAVQEETAQHTEPQGVFSGQSTRQSFDARDIKPRKKTGWGKRIAVMLLSGLLIGSTAAGAYLGVTYFGKRYILQQDDSGNNPVTEATEEIKKEPEISIAEPMQPDLIVAEGPNVSYNVAYDVSDVVDNVMPAMVSIINKYTETIESWFGQSYTQENASSGSGIIIGENETELLVATNYHVVGGSDVIEVTFIDGSTATAYIKGTDPQMDLAVVAVVLETLTPETKAAIAVASLGNSDALRLGEPVIAIGNALGYGQSVTTGVVSALNRQISVEGTEGSFIQTDAAINPGNSGGALLNMQGEVIGINSSKIGGSAIEGMGYAIPLSAAQPIIDDLSLQSTKIKVDVEKRGYLGISIKEISSDVAQAFNMPQGVYVAEVVEGGGAKQAGMQVRDIIIKFDTFQIENYSDLQDALQYYEIGTTVSVEVMRIVGNEYQSVILQVTLGEKPA